jgi:hypothetical protein
MIPGSRTLKGTLLYLGMALDKSIKHGKDWRKPYFKSERFDASCRPGGSCPYCQGNRRHNINKQRARANEQLKELKNQQD